MKANFSILSRAILSVGLAALAVGCSKAPTDAKVTSDIQAKLGADSGLQDKQIAVQSANGTVTLSGTVETEAERDAAAKYAASEPGVRTVINNLQVGTTQANAQPAPQQEPAPSSQAAKPASSKRHHRSERHEQEMAQANPPADQSQYSQPQAPPPAADAQPPAPAAQQPATPPPPPEPAPVTVPSGAVLSVRLIDTIDSATAQDGDTFHATLDAPLAVDGNVVVPAHYEVEGHVVNAQASGKFRGQALLVLQLDQLKVNGRVYNIQTDQFKQETSARGKNTAEKVGAGQSREQFLVGSLAEVKARRSARLQEQAPEAEFRPRAKSPI